MNKQKNYTKSELANLYGYSFSKFYRALQRMGFYEEFSSDKNSQILTPLQYNFIIKNIGKPPKHQ